MTTFINEKIDDGFNLLIEGELFNGVNTYATDIIIIFDTGMAITGYGIGIPDNICKKLRLKGGKKTEWIVDPVKKESVKCPTVEVGIRLKENKITKKELDKVKAIILSNLTNNEVIIGSEFLINYLGCKRIIIDYENYSFRLVI